MLALVASETSAAVSVALALTALPPAEDGFSPAVPVSGVLAEPPLDGVVLPDGLTLGLPLGDDGGGESGGVVLGLVLGDGDDESIVLPGDGDDPVVYRFVVGLHDGEGPGVRGAEECDRCDP